MIYVYRHPAFARPLLRSLVPIVCPAEQVHRLNVINPVVDEVERSIASMPHSIQAALVVGMLAYDNSARFHPSHIGKRASQLSDKQAAAWFAYWRQGLALQTNFIKGIRGLIALSFYEQPAVMSEIGYTPQAWMNSVAKRRLAMYADDIHKHEATQFELDPIPLPSEVAARAATLSNRAIASAIPASNANTPCSQE